MGGGVVLGRDAGGGLEHAVEITRTATDRVSEHLQRCLFFTFLDYPARLRDECRILGLDRWAIRITPFAGPEAGGLCALQGVMELDILGIGSARGARRSAIDARGVNRVPQMAVRRLSRATIRAQRGSSATDGS